MAKKFGYECPDFRGRELAFGERAGAIHLNKAQANSFWQGRNAIYDVELEAIKREITIKLDEQFRRKRDSSIKLKDIKEMWENTKEQLNSYLNIPREESARLSPQKNEYIKKTIMKSYGLGTAFNIMLWMAIFLEIFVILAQTVAMSIAEGGYIDTPSIVVAIFMGILLAIGGWSVGVFFGVWWFDNELENNNIGEEHLKPAHWFVLVIGIILILFVSFTRMITGGGIFSLVISLILGLLVAIFKGFKEYFEGLRCFVGQYRVLYFRREASRQHDDKMKEYEKFFNDTVKEMSSRYNVTIEEV